MKGYSMKKQILLGLFLLSMVSLFVAGCSDSTTNPVESTKQGAYVTSIPAGVAIVIDGKSTGYTTPALIDTLSVGSHTITLSRTNYNDLAINVTTTASKIDTLSKTMTSSVYSIFGPVRVWVKSDPSTSHPSGLCLRNGTAYGISSNANDSYVDFYLADGTSTAGDSVASPVKLTNFTRNTFFLGSSDATLKVGNVTAYGTGSWAQTLSLSANKSFVVYDNDNNYAKVIVSNSGVDATTSKNWVEFYWIYNSTSGSYEF
jgi:hypothetical protein